MRDRGYFDPNEKLPFWEDLIFDHKRDENIDLLVRTGMNPGFVHMACWAILLVIVVILQIF